MSEFRQNRYSAVLALLLLGILLAGAYALSLLVQGEAAYPVRMIGQAQLSAELVDAELIRPPGPVVPAVGTMPRLLPLPPPPKYSEGTWKSSDPSYRDLVGPETRLLDAARKYNEKEEWSRSLPLYNSLVAAHPQSLDLALERAHVLTWAGHNAAAAPALLAVARARRSPTLAFEAAQNYWWSGNPVTADSTLDVVVSLDPSFPGVSALRQQVRASASPSLAVAREWARDGGELEQMLYARALVAANDYATAIEPYRKAIAFGAPDSVRLEMAAAANAADSADVAIASLRSYIARHEDADDIRLTLARQFGWSERYADAVTEYDALIARGHRELAVERAQTIVWSGDLPKGAAALRVALREDSTQVEAWKLLGDVERWLAHPKEALVAYRRASALQPDDPVLTMQIASVQEDIRLALRAGLPATSARVQVAGLHDNTGFSYLQTRAEQFFATQWGGFQLAAVNTLPTRSVSPGVAYSGNGYGAEAGATYRPRRNVRLDAGASAQHYGDVGTFLGFNAAVSLDVITGTTVRLGYVREPAVRRAGTLLALQARTVSERIELLASGRLGTWGWSAQAENEALNSDLGNTRRTAAAIAANYALTKELQFDARVSGLHSSGVSPSLPGFGALYWSPEYYVEPTAGLSYRKAVSKSLTLGGGVTGGYAFTKERPGPGARFTRPTLPTFGVRVDAGYQRGPWSLLVDVGYGGAVGTGYRSVNSTLGISYTIPR